MLLNTGARDRPVEGRPADDGGYRMGGEPDLRARGIDRGHRLRGAVAARPAGDHRVGVGDRSARDSVPDNGGVYFVPAFSGLFAPYWRSDARGAIVGLSRFNTKAHLARATLEAICFQTRAVLDAMVQDSGVRLEVLKVDGGATVNDLLMQLQADILGVPVVRPVVAETTALGAAYAAGLAVGFWKDLDDLRANWRHGQALGTALERGSEATRVRERGRRRSRARSTGSDAPTGLRTLVGIGLSPWASRRPPGKARGARIPGVCKRRATQPGGMHRRPRWQPYSDQGPKAVESRTRATRCRACVRRRSSPSSHRPSRSPRPAPARRAIRPSRRRR